MAYRDREVATVIAPIPAQADWRLPYERTLKRAEATEARAEKLRWAEVAARAKACRWKSHFEASLRKRQEAFEETKRVRRVAKDALLLEAEVARLTRHDPDTEHQSAAFDTALDSLFAHAGRDLTGLPDNAREGKGLRSLMNHREGLSVFVGRPRVPLDNNLS